MLMNVDVRREGWVGLLGREARPGVLAQESRGSSKSPERIKGKEEKKTIKNSANPSKKSSNREGAEAGKIYTGYDDGAYDLENDSYGDRIGGGGKYGFGTQRKFKSYLDS